MHTQSMISTHPTAATARCSSPLMPASIAHRHAPPCADACLARRRAHPGTFRSILMHSLPRISFLRSGNGLGTT